MLKNQEKQENHIRDLETKLEYLNNVSKTELINIIRKSAFLIEQFEKLVIKNKFGSDIYNNIESFFLDKYYEKVFKNIVYYMNNLEPKIVELKQDIWFTMIMIYFSLFI